jgi:hypothetical protein
MRKYAYLTAAIAVALSGASLANDPSSPKSGPAVSSQRPALSAAAQCEQLVGDKKEQCMRQAQQTRSNTDAAVGATTGSGAAGAGSSAPQSQSTPSGGAATGTARP